MFEPESKTITTVSQLMAVTMQIHYSESEAFNALRPLLTNLLGKDVGQLSSKGSRTSDGLVYKQVDEYYVPLVCIEYKRSFGEGGCDPSVQAAYSVREFLVLDKVRGFSMLFHTR